MTISKTQREVLEKMRDKKGISFSTQAKEYRGADLSIPFSIYIELAEKGYAKDMSITPLGIEALGEK